ncbi:MAG TPA: HAD-IC family P-type ATPase [Jatrophihabitans sp.]|nr:HAD-IC family P-type ATPase [Jatrophihabitans sp.]
MSTAQAQQSIPRAPTTTAGTSPVSDLARAASQEIPEVLRRLGVASADSGLSEAEAARRRDRFGPNAVASHRARLLAVLWHQMRSPLLGLLVAAAIASAFVGEHTNAIIIVVIVGLSVGLGFANEYRAEKAAEALHSQMRQRAVVVRDARQAELDVTDLVPGDVLQLKLGDIVPADVRLLDVAALQCDESVLTGESLPVDKQTAPVPAGTVLAELSSCALMGTVVHAGSGRALVISTGARTEFGAIAAGLATRQLDTEFQIGLRQFSMLLVYVAGALTTAIFAINVALHKPVLDALLFSLAIAVGITPQLLPAVVSTSLAAGSRQLSRRKVLVKRLVCIEDLGDVDTLLTDKTGTLTQGRIDYMRTVPESGRPAEQVLRWGLLCTENAVAGQPGVGGNPLDQALWDSPAAAEQRNALLGFTRLAVCPFDHDRMLVSVLVRGPDGALTQVTKGAPEAVLARCAGSSEQSRVALQREFDDGNRVVAVAVRPVDASEQHARLDEHALAFAGLLVFLDRPKPDAAESLRRLADLGIAVKVVTGDNPAVAAKVCAELGLPAGGTLTGAQIQQLDDAALEEAVAATTVFARTSPEDKARIVRTQRREGKGVAFLGDGVNDALALHAADVGISVDSATDVAKDAADVILLEKSLAVLADGVAEGRRIFANTIKYVLMGTSSNFGNMFSAAGASLFLTFLPMLPSQILLNNLALRRQPARHPHRQRRRGATAPTLALGRPVHPAVHARVRPHQLHLRLRHLRRHARRLPRRRGGVPVRLVHRIARHPDPGDLRDPHAPLAVLPQPPQPAADAGGAHRGRGRHAAARVGRRIHTRLPAPAERLLRRARGDDRLLSRADRAGEADVLPAGARAPAASAVPARPAGPAAGRAVQHRAANGPVRGCRRRSAYLSGPPSTDPPGSGAR